MAFNEQISIINLPSLNENEDTLIFPADSSIQKEIPLYLKMTCVEYSMVPLQRAGGIATQSHGGVGNVKAYIYVPVPSKLVTQTAMRYKQEDNEKFMGGEIQDKVEEALAIAQGSVLTRAFDAVLGGFDFLRPFAPPSAKRVARAFSSLMETDFTETILQSGSKRSFTISMYLPCLNVADSLAAAKIARALEALSLPTMIAASAFAGLAGAQLHFHPPMWFFGIGRLNGVRTDIDWTSQPQASVLTNVAVSRSAIDAASFTALDGNIKPVAYSITLQFQEIETAFRRTGTASGGTTSYEIVNRSGAFVGGDNLALNVSFITP